MKTIHRANEIIRLQNYLKNTKRSLEIRKKGIIQTEEYIQDLENQIERLKAKLKS